MRGIIRSLKGTSGINLNLASKIFVTQNGKLNKNFVQESQKTFKSSVQQLNFDEKDKAELIVNEYVRIIIIIIIVRATDVTSTNLIDRRCGRSATKPFAGWC